MNIEKSGELEGLFMSNPSVPSGDPLQGTFALAALTSDHAARSLLAWLAPEPLVEFTSCSGRVLPRDGQLRAEARPAQLVERFAKADLDTRPGEATPFHLYPRLSWNFPNRTPDWCGWAAPAGEGKTIIGNYYATRFNDAWEVARYMVTNLNRWNRAPRPSPFRSARARFPPL